LIQVNTILFFELASLGHKRKLKKKEVRPGTLLNISIKRWKAGCACAHLQVCPSIQYRKKKESLLFVICLNQRILTNTTLSSQ